MSDRGIVRCRRILTVATCAVFVVLAVIVLVGVMPSGNWVTIHVGEAETEMDGFNLSADFDMNLDSAIPYDISDLECSLILIDRDNGSAITLGDIAPVTIVAGNRTCAHVSADIFAPGAFLILSDMIDRDGSVLHFNLKVSCGYLMGLADIDLNMDVDLPLSEKGDRLEISKERVSGSEFKIRVMGLAERLVPDDMLAEFKGNGDTVVIGVDSEGRDVTVALNANGRLEDTMASVASSDDFNVSVTGGSSIKPDKDTLLTLVSLLKILEKV